MADARNILVAKLRQYKLCRQCLERHGSRQKPDAHCYICRGLFGEKELMLKRIVAAAKGYEYDTFLIGAVLPTQIYEREDAMRARLKIRGRESVKNQLTRELGVSFARGVDKSVEYLLPDLMINLVIDKENNVGISTKSRPLLLLGRYTKKGQGLAQKQDRCESCEGKGCSECDHSGLSGYDSVEGVIAKGLMRFTKGQTPKFSWFGSEDRSSLVLGKGRPFYAKLFDPRRRRFKTIRIKNDPIAATLMPRDDDPDTQARFIVKTRILVSCERVLSKDDLKKIGTRIVGDVKFENRSKIATRRIYSANLKRIDERSLSLTIVADGGLMIKQFVGGEEYMEPNISEILGTKCVCVTFDILDVQLLNL